jgi:hypothetical protein
VKVSIKARARAVAVAGVVATSLVSVSRVAVAAPSGAPSATDLAAARALFAQGSADEQAGRWADALDKMRRASTVKMTPGLRFHIALCEEKLGHLVAALEGYTAAQDAARAENNREVLKLASEPLLALKLRMPTVLVDVPLKFLMGPARAEVSIDGVTLAPESFGKPTPVDVGTHTIQARARGQTPYAVTITVVERQAATLAIPFTPLPGYHEDVPVVAVAPVPAPTEPRSPAVVSTTGAHHSSALAIVATAGAVVLIGGGVGAFAAAGSDQSYWNGACQSKPQPCGNRTPVRAWDATALTAWVAGAGVGIVAVVLWTQPTKGEHEAPHAELHGGPGSLFLSGTF